jgi:hypothetical protein
VCTGGHRTILGAFKLPSYAPIWWYKSYVTLVTAGEYNMPCPILHHDLPELIDASEPKSNLPFNLVNANKPKPDLDFHSLYPSIMAGVQASMQAMQAKQYMQSKRARQYMQAMQAKQSVQKQRQIPYKYYKMPQIFPDMNYGLAYDTYNIYTPFSGTGIPYVPPVRVRFTQTRPSAIVPKQYVKPKPKSNLRLKKQVNSQKNIKRANIRSFRKGRFIKKFGKIN